MSLALDASIRIKNSAELFLESTHILSMLEQFGQVLITGSFALNTMVWNDLDLQIEVPPESDERVVMATIVENLIRTQRLKELKYIDFYIKKKPTMPKGRYIGLEILDEKTSDSWKVDLWMLSKKDFEANRSFMFEMTRELVGPIRDLVVELKWELTQKFGRPPQLASYFIYQAVAYEGLRDHSMILNYLEKNGVDLSGYNSKKA